MKEITREKWLGRSQAAVKAAMPPEEEPQRPRPAGSLEMLYCLATSGRISSVRKRAYRSVVESYSKERLKRGWALASLGGGMAPGLMKTPMVTGISFLWIRLSITVVARKEPFSPTKLPPSW